MDTPSSKRQKKNINDGNSVAWACARFIVCREGTKVPINKEEIIRYLNHYERTEVKVNDFKVIYKNAEEILKQVYGYKLQPLSDEGKSFIVMLNNTTKNQEVFFCEEDIYRRRLLNATLTHIFMSGGDVTEDDLITFLKKADLIKDIREDEQKQRLLLSKTFTKQQYLLKEKQDNIHIFRWGPRATLEVPKKFLLEKVCEAMGKEPNYFAKQNMEAALDEIDKNKNYK